MNIVVDTSKFDENKIPNPGKFFMYNGKLQYNTAFHRGGAINVESDFVVLKGGEITYNNGKKLDAGPMMLGMNESSKYQVRGII